MTNRKTLATAFAMMAAALVQSAPVQAQQGTTPPPPAAGQRGPGPTRRGPPSVDERVQRMTTELSLSAEQANKVKALLNAEQRGMDSVLARRVAERDAERAAMETRRTANQKALAAILTPDQKLKHDAMRARMDRGGRGGRGHDGPRRGFRGRDDRDGRDDGRRGPPRDDRRGPPNDRDGASTNGSQR